MTGTAKMLGWNCCCLLPLLWLRVLSPHIQPDVKRHNEKMQRAKLLAALRGIPIQSSIVCLQSVNSQSCVYDEGCTVFFFSLPILARPWKLLTAPLRSTGHWRPRFPKTRDHFRHARSRRRVSERRFGAPRYVCLYVFICARLGMGWSHLGDVFSWYGSMYCFWCLFRRRHGTLLKGRGLG